VATIYECDHCGVATRDAEQTNQVSVNYVCYPDKTLKKNQYARYERVEHDVTQLWCDKCSMELQVFLRPKTDKATKLVLPEVKST
jgi:hypothetical protein